MAEQREEEFVYHDSESFGCPKIRDFSHVRKVVLLSIEVEKDQ